MTDIQGDVPPFRRVFAPGRVNLIGDHTDYMRALCSRWPSIAG